MIKNKELKELLVKALNTDGDHHKQWYLEEILRKTTTKKEHELLKAINDWDEGQAP